MGTALRGLIAAEVRAEMARQRKTGVELAALLDVSQQAASRRLAGAVPFSMDEIVVVAQWLGVEVVTLIPREVSA